MRVVTYLINLDSSYERYESAKKQLNDLNWTFEKISAVDGRGKSLSDFPDYDDSLARQRMGRSLLNSEIGCYLSHYRCVSEFLASDADYLVVLEDDMQLSDDFKAVMTQLLDFLYTNKNLDWYLINIAANKKKIAQNITQINNHTLWHAYYFPILGLGLVWSRQGAKEFLEKGKSITMPVDMFFQDWLCKNAKGLGIWPALVTPTDVDSDIWSEAKEKNIKRKALENRDWSYSLKKKKRMLYNKSLAIKHLSAHK